MVYEILMLGDSIWVKAVRMYLDNTSAVARFSKMRAATPVAVSLMHVLSVYCGAVDIGLFPAHVAGLKNIRADYLSRSLSYHVLQMEEIVVEDTKDSDWWRNLPIEAVCRQLLLRLVIKHSPMPTDSALRLASFLVPTPKC